MILKKWISQKKKLKILKNKKLTMITSLRCTFAKLFWRNADMILVGDSLNMSFAGKSQILFHNTWTDDLSHKCSMCRCS